MRRHAAAALLFVALAIAMTWPLARNLGRAVAYPGDPYINIWILDWVHHALLTQPSNLFDANAFHPANYALAFSENLVGLALVLMPFRAAGVDALTTYNLAMLLGYAFSGFAAYLLGWTLTRSLPAAIAAGVFHAFVPFRFTHATHVQHVWGGWLPMLLVALLWFVRKPTWRRAAVFGAVFLMNGLTNVHWLLFGSVAIGLSALLYWRIGARLAVATAVAIALLLPVLLPYTAASRLYGMERRVEETSHFSAKPADWLAVSDKSRTYRQLINLKIDPERWLFPGALSLVVGALGAFAARRQRKTLSIAILWILLGFLGSLGLHFVFHRLLFEFVPGFRAIRAPARWAAITYVGLAMLIAFGTTWLGRRQRWIAAAIPLLFLIELRAAPIRWFLTEPEPPEVYRWLAAQKGDIAVAELPIDVAESEYLYLLHATAHRKRIVNGVSGFETPQHAKLNALAKANPIGDELVDTLRAYGVDYVIVHADVLIQTEEPTRAWLRRELERGRLALVGRFAAGPYGDWVFSLRPTATAARPPELEAFLRGERTYNEATFGSLDYPVAHELWEQNAWISGYGLSPFGVRNIDILFNNGGMRFPTTLLEDRKLLETMRFYDATIRPRFVASFPRRPDGVWRETDIQIEITDNLGRKTRLPHRWVTWP